MGGIVSSPSRLSLRLPAPRRFASFTLLSVDNATSEPPPPRNSPPPSDLSLNSSFCNMAFLRCNSSPTSSLKAFKRAAESLEKLMDATREELPDTMAAVRLSGMEISDLDNGAQGEMETVDNMKPIVSVQEVAPMRAQIGEPVLARTARRMREGIVKGRGVVQMLFTLTRYSKCSLTTSLLVSKA
ncbi:hypothetical protein SASPL_150339 [Salvia splendens]|uniref:Uncharacterized protein n=1 Tax=Salvia splendens TaxID=180675 RepID=A0A8X8Z2D7_SALSN|nr:hypothetical protein SASPL_150339 [Salvia splendens]